MRQRYELDEDVRRLGGEFALHPSLINLIAKMMAFEPAARFQTPALMHEAVKAVREEMASGGGKVASRQASGPLTVFVIENHNNLQNTFREKLKEMGFRVLMTIDPDQALKRYQQQPYHALLVDAGTVGREGLDAYDRVMKEAELMHLDIVGVVIMNEDQGGWANAVKPRPGGHALVRPVTMKQLSRLFKKTLPLPDKEPAEAE
jgi:serine/threonine-protein kinase